MHPVLFEASSAWVVALFSALGAAVVLHLAFARWPRLGIAPTLAGSLGVALLAHGIAAPGARAIPVFSYGAMLGGSFAVAWWMVMWLGPRHERLSREDLASAFLVTAAFAMVGARLLFLLTNPSLLANPARWLAVGDGGMVAYGGFLGGLAGGWLFWRRKRVSVLAWGDLAAPALGSGLMLTRIGCYLYGCDFGAPLGASAPAWLVRLGSFPRGSPAFTYHVHRYGLSSTAASSLPVHPTQLYESLAGLVLFAVALSLLSRRRFRGEVVLVVALLYAVWRFLIELVRDDPQRGFYFGLSTSQLISLVLVPAAIWAWFEARRRSSAALLPAWAFDARVRVTWAEKGRTR